MLTWTISPSAHSFFSTMPPLSFEIAKDRLSKKLGRPSSPRSGKDAQEAAENTSLIKTDITEDFRIPSPMLDGLDPKMPPIMRKLLVSGASKS